MSFQQHAQNARGSAMLNLLQSVSIGGGSFTSPDNMYKASWMPFTLAGNAAGIEITMEANTNGWVGFGWTLSDRPHITSDMIVGWVSNGQATLLDRFSSNLGVVPVDDIQNVQLVSALEENGVTRITFRRLLVTGDTAMDVDILDRMVLWQWAYGVQDGNGITFQQHSSSGRGSMMLNLIRDSTGASGSFVSSDNLYRASWMNVMIGDTPGIQVDMEARTSGWVGFGWTQSGRPHVNSDMIVGWITNGQATLWDRWSTNLGIVPVDEVQNVQLVMTSEVNGVTRIVFRRPLSTGDSAQDVDVTNQPVLFQWAYGELDGNGMAFQQHAAGARGSATVNLLQSSSPVAPGQITPSPPPQVSPGSGSFQSPDGGYSLRWRLPDSNSIEWTIEARTSGWVGLGWTNGARAHRESDMIVAWVDVNNQGNVLGFFSMNTVTSVFSMIFLY
jgi:hypothetical protein